MWPFQNLSLGGGLELDLSDLNSSYADLGALTQTYRVEIEFTNDSTVDVLREFQSDLLDEQVDYVKPLGSLPNVYVRCLYVSGDHMTAGDAEDTWHLLGSGKQFIMQHTSAGGEDYLLGTFKFQLSTDGSTVHEDTGNVTIQVGELF